MRPMRRLPQVVLRLSPKPEGCSDMNVAATNGFFHPTGALGSERQSVGRALAQRLLLPCDLAVNTAVSGAAAASGTQVGHTG